MSIALLDGIMSSWFGYTGDYTLIALGILVFFIVALVLVGIELRFAMLFTLPLAAVFSAQGWFAAWFSVMFWFAALGIGGYMLWTSISER